MPPAIKMNDILSETAAEKITAQICDAAEPVASVKQFSRLAAGDVFKALVTDIRPDRLTLRLVGGEQITAKINAAQIPNARIGEYAQFTVLKNASSQIVLSNVCPEAAPEAASKLADSALFAALAEAFIPADKENLALCAALKNAGLPLGGATLEKAFFFNALEGATPEKIVFLLKEGFPESPEAMNVLNEALEKSGGAENALTDALRRVFFYLSESGDIGAGDGAARKILEFFRPVFEVIESGAPSEGAPPNEAKTREEGAFRAQTVRLPAFNLKKPHLFLKTPEFFKELSEALRKTAVLLENDGGKGARKHLAAVREARAQIRFMEGADAQKYFLQIPLINEKTVESAQIYVFKKAPGQKNGGQKPKTALISAAYPNLGYIEAFISVEAFVSSEQNGADIVFRVEQKNALPLVEAALGALGAEFKSRGRFARLRAVALKERFNVLKNEIETANKPAARNSFDVRV